MHARLVWRPKTRSRPGFPTISVVPEPSTYVIAGFSSVGLAGMMRWRRNRGRERYTENRSRPRLAPPQ